MQTKKKYSSGLTICFHSIVDTFLKQALRTEAAENMSELTGKLEELKKKKRVTEDVVAEAKRRNQEIKVTF